jgi:hypothetical protein
MAGFKRACHRATAAGLQMRQDDAAAGIRITFSAVPSFTRLPRR